MRTRGLQREIPTIETCLVSTPKNRYSQLGAYSDGTSFVDFQEHEILMSTMFGAAVMDTALLLIAGNESCPQPQSSENLAAIEMNHIIILRNKLDLMRKAPAEENFSQLIIYS